MEKNRVCKICSRCFSSGKAIGGHMRSHFAKLPLPPKLDSAESTTDRAKSGCRSSNRRPSDTNHGERGCNKTKPKLRPEPAIKTPEHSSTSDDLSEEDVALCLMMLSRNWWKDINVGAAAAATEEEEEDNDDHSDEDDETFCLTRDRSRAEYRCETCNKCFRSYQALGGHRASHTNNNYAITGQANRRIFECPYCYRVFDSGQALGGHKKVHPHSSNANNDSVSVLTDKNPIDLNIPVMREEEDEEVLSEFKVPNDDEEMFRQKKRRIFQLQ